MGVQIEPWDPPRVRAAKLGMVGPFTPAEYARIADPLIVPTPAVDVEADPAVIAAGEAVRAAREVFDGRHAEWVRAVAARSEAELMGRGTARLLAEDRNFTQYTQEQHQQLTVVNVSRVEGLREAEQEALDARDAAWAKVVKAMGADKRARDAALRAAMLAEQPAAAVRDVEPVRVAPGRRR